MLWLLCHGRQFSRPLHNLGVRDTVAVVASGLRAPGPWQAKVRLGPSGPVAGGGRPGTRRRVASSV